ncbi:acyltransferase family protein [Peribacillus acanthi]|uniref:acyltransferase family protein n=1 Tax=Peribacillus acanthi TaxID=2171554 RepID=UPI001300607F|nr:acyltransferase [Peribacillus acanthi]
MEGRLYYLDWLRVVATFVVFIYHVVMFFNPFPWHVKNIELDGTYMFLFTMITSLWIMPLFFLISGASTYFALQRYSVSQLAKDRLIRLGIPLIVAVFFLSPPQVYIERITLEQFNGSFFQFLPHYFDGLYLDIGGPGNFAFVGLHLWYVFFLLIFTYLTLPIFKKMLDSGKGSSPSFIGFGIFLFISYLLLFVETIGLGGWDLLYYLFVFIAGFKFISNSTFMEKVRAYFPILLIIGFVVAGWYGYISLGDAPSWISAKSAVLAVRVLGSWSLIFVLLGLFMMRFNRKTKTLQIGSKYALPFYILHQPIIVVIGYFLSSVEIAIPLKFILLLVLSFFIISILLWLFEKIRILRLPFGFK